MKLLLVTILLLSSVVTVWANDSAVETAVGGLKLRKENGVLMKKERLYISRNIVRVEYEFLNTTSDLVVSEIAFPIPPTKYVFDDLGGRRDFADFKVWIDDKPMKVEKEVRAFVGKREVTDELLKAKISIETFGDFDPTEPSNQIFSLRPEAKSALVKVGALKKPSKKDNSLDYWPRWETHVKYHWRQEFPPGEIVRIKHEYHPVVGYQGAQVQKFKEQHKDACIEPKTFSEVKRRVEKTMEREPLSNNYFQTTWVSYILTTANTWQTPIKDFELTVEGENDDLLAFCWDGPVEKTGQSKARALKIDFVPKSDLKVYFLSQF